MPNPSEDTPVVEIETVLPRAIVTLTEQEGNAGGFTIGLLLASQQNTEDDPVFRIPVIDIVALAVVNTLKKIPAEFKAELDRVNSAVAKLSEDLASDIEAEAAIAAFNAEVGVAAYVRQQG